MHAIVIIDIHLQEIDNYAIVCTIYNVYVLILIYVTISAKTVLNGTFIITRKTDLKYSRCCGSVVLDFSHARFTV